MEAIVPTAAREGVGRDGRGGSVDSTWIHAPDARPGSLEQAVPHTHQAARGWIGSTASVCVLRAEATYTELPTRGRTECRAYRCPTHVRRLGSSLSQLKTNSDRVILWGVLCHIRGEDLIDWMDLGGIHSPAAGTEKGTHTRPCLPVCVVCVRACV